MKFRSTILKQIESAVWHVYIVPTSLIENPGHFFAA